MNPCQPSDVREVPFVIEQPPEEKLFSVNKSQSYYVDIYGQVFL